MTGYYINQLTYYFILFFLTIFSFYEYSSNFEWRQIYCTCHTHFLLYNVHEVKYFQVQGHTELLFQLCCGKWWFQPSTHCLLHFWIISAPEQYFSHSNLALKFVCSCWNLAFPIAHTRWDPKRALACIGEQFLSNKARWLFFWKCPPFYCIPYMPLKICFRDPSNLPVPVFR